MRTPDRTRVCEGPQTRRANDCTRVDPGVKNKWQQVGKLADTESVNDEDGLRRSKKNVSDLKKHTQGYDLTGSLNPSEGEKTHRRAYPNKVLKLSRSREKFANFLGRNKPPIEGVAGRGSDLPRAARPLPSKLGALKRGHPLAAAASPGVRSADSQALSSQDPPVIRRHVEEEDRKRASQAC